MTIETLDNRINQDADGAQTTFPFNFKTFEVDSIVIYFDAVVQETGFTVTLNTDQDLAPGGVVDFDVAPVLDVVVTIQRLVTDDQKIAYQPYDPFPAATHEGALDKLTMISQQLAEELDRAYKAPINTEPGLDFVMPPYDAGKLLGWSDTEEGVIDNSPYAFQDISDEADKAIASAAAALISEGLARDYANEDEDIEVEGSLFSAKHYAIKAAKSVGGIRIRGIISADNLCDKPGDDAGDCNEPDYRNPSERFTDFVFQGGDAFIVSSLGDMNLNDVDNPGSELVQSVAVGDYLIYLPEIRSDGDLIIAEGWHPQEGLSAGGTTANLVTFDDASTTAKGTDVQAFNVALDIIVEAMRILVDGKLDKSGDTMTGALQIQGNLNGGLILQRTNPGIQDVRWNDVSGAARLFARFDENNGTGSIELRDTGNVIIAVITIQENGNISCDAPTPLSNNDLTRKDYVDTQVGTKKNEADFVRTGTRLDINNVGT